MDERNPLPGRMSHKLNLDSEEEKQREEEERLEREQEERQRQEKRKRKEEKRKAKEEEERLAQEEALQRQQKKKKQIEKYSNPAILLEPDSDSNCLARLKRKVDFMFPKFAKKKANYSDDSSEEQQDGQELEQSGQSEDNSSGSQDEEQSSEEESSRPKHRSKKQKKSQKRRRDQSGDEENNVTKNKVKGSVKIQSQMTAKDKLVQQFAVRWYYALPEWPPKDFDYGAELKKKGYRLVQTSKFKFVDEVVDGLIKVQELEGYPGVYKGKNGLVDVRPKSNCPTINYLYSFSQEELTELLKKALAVQLQQLQRVPYKTSVDLKVLQDLKRRLNQLGA